MQPEQIIANFLRRPEDGGAYTDHQLAALLAHAEDGKLVHYSCCCLIGIPTADHALKGRHRPLGAHFVEALRLPGAAEANPAFACLFDYPTPTP